MRFPPNASNYGNSMYNSGSPSNQQQSSNFNILLIKLCLIVRFEKHRKLHKIRKRR